MHSSDSESVQQDEAPRISFSADFFEEGNITSILKMESEEDGKESDKEQNPNFEFLSSKSSNQSMLTADELFYDGKLLPYWKVQLSEKLSLSPKEPGRVKAAVQDPKDEPPVNWYVDEDPSPRPPTCNVLWKELLRLKKQRASTLSPSPSCSYSSSSQADGAANQSRNGKPEKRTKKGIERTKSISMRMRPIIFVPVSNQSKSRTLPTLFR